MLEYKDILIDVNGEAPVFSLNLAAGDIACLRIGGEEGRRLLRASLGMGEVSRGFISYDGELVTPGSGAFFRRHMAYVPFDVPDVDMEVLELYRMVGGATDNATDSSSSREKVLSLLRRVGLPEHVLHSSVKALGSEEVQLVLLSFVPLLKRRVVLVDRPVVSNAVSDFIRDLGHQGQEVVYTTQDSPMVYTRLLNLKEI